VLAENIGGTALDSAETTLAVTAQHAFALGETVRMPRVAWAGRMSSLITRRGFRQASPVFAAAASR
jgi:hypothetical protein